MSNAVTIQPTKPDGDGVSELEVLTPEDFEGNAHDIANEALEAFQEWLKGDTPQVVQVDPRHLRPKPMETTQEATQRAKRQRAAAGRLPCHGHCRTADTLPLLQAG